MDVVVAAGDRYRFWGRESVIFGRDVMEISDISRLRVKMPIFKMP